MTNRPPALDPFHEACHWGAFSLGLKPSAVLLPCRPRPCRGGRPADGRPPPRLHAAAAVESGAGKKTRTHKDKLLTAWMRDRRSPCASALCAHEPQLSRVKRQSLGQRHCAGESARRRGQIKFIRVPFCHRRPRASLSRSHFAISCAILLSFVPNLSRMARRIAIAILCAKDVDQ